ncbi:PREDICTED: ubiquitin carboxyl-terminal hydrolase 47-like [Acropora digitifera]|uniref:ubiquitin carboxyl-terminal hydrolase 47-like n=1 Tax=Acropora digitifera TaxID=70779 RepID=UPI00077A4FF4|nr:PREDICTED: ubiquitin carboxyl-terminal hydrolase 47-like [Acropora digitifera]
MVNATTKEVVPVENANPSDEPTVLCIIKDETTSDWKNSKHTINLPASTPVQELIAHAAKEAKYVEDSFLLVWSKPQGNEEILLNAYKDKTLQEVGLVSNGKKNSFLIKDKDGVQPTKNKDDTNDILSNSVSNLFQSSSTSSYSSFSPSDYSLTKSETGFVGLVNQAMTCYLNSLLQTLFMTPEFRNAIYRWEFTGSEDEAGKSIPYQLQKLFLLLQYLPKQCGYESARTDTYLDIPLAIRPFGSLTALGSVENALQNFIAPEVLNDTNQYFCEKCNEKCDAHKGLKFISFPYLLTLQLKRFAFDYATLHRVKLNDRMTFPEYLYLKDFVSEEHEETDADEDSSVKGDSQSSTETDSGVSEGCSDNGMSTEEEDFDNARGGADPVGLASENLEESEEMLTNGITDNMKVCETLIEFLDEVEPELYCKVYDDDIERTYGGVESSRHYYSSVYTSSTNAYMLMYRKVAPERNAKFMELGDVPKHIAELIHKLKNHEEMERRRKEMDRSMCKIKIFCEHPLTKKRMERKLEIHKDKTLEDAVSVAHKLFFLDKVVPIEQCRIVKYDEYYDFIERSFDGEENDPMGRVLCGVKQSYMFDLLLETIMPHERFLPYKSGGTTVKVHVVDLQREKVAPPVNVRPLLNSTAKDLHILIHERFDLPLETLRVVLEGSYNELKLLDRSDKSLKELGFFRSNKVIPNIRQSFSGRAEDQRMTYLKPPIICIICLFCYFREGRFHHSKTIRDSISFKVVLVSIQVESFFFFLPAENMSRIICETDDDSNKNEKTSEKLFPIDKRITLGNLKEILQSEVGCSPEYFRVYRVYSSSQEIEYNKLSDQLTSFNDDAKVRVKYSRAPKKGEHQLKIFMLNATEKEPVKYLFDWIVSDGMTVKQCKELLHPEICERCDTDIPLENLRLRRKSWKNPGRVYTDEQVFEDSIKVYASFEVFLEILEESMLKRIVGLQLIIDLWLLFQMSELSGIPVEDLELCKGRGQFPCEASILEIHGNDFGWASDMLQLRSIPLLINDDGAVVYYRDKNKELLEITEEKKQEIMSKENAKSASSTTRGGRFSHKEKALKIYTDDNQPKK